MLEAQEAPYYGRPVRLRIETIIWKMANTEEHRIRQVLWQAKREAAPKPNNKPTITEGVHVCRVCGLVTPATGDDFYYPAAPACGHYTESGHPNTEYRPAPPPAPVMTGPPPKAGSALQGSPMPDAKPRRDVGPIPKIKARKGCTKNQREMIVRRLHGINLEDATDTAIQLTDILGESVVTFRKPEYAHNLYYYLTGEKLFEEFGPYKPGRNGGGNGRKPDHEIIPAEADKAMRLYGYPTHAAAILRRQAETYEANDVKLHRLFYPVVSELESRAEDKTWYGWRGRLDEADWFHLENRLEAIGQPLTAAGRVEVA